MKYMYAITTSEAAKFLTSDFIPVSNDSTVSAAAVDGKIESLKVTAGSGTQMEHTMPLCMVMVQVLEHHLVR